MFIVAFKLIANENLPLARFCSNKPFCFTVSLCVDSLDLKLNPQLSKPSFRELYQLIFQQSTFMYTSLQGPITFRHFQLHRYSSIKKITTCTFAFHRACRLKKKAQHEANKVKLQGLEMEQRELKVVSFLYSWLILNKVCHQAW